MKLSRYIRRVAAGAAASALCLSATFSLLAPTASAVTQDPELTNRAVEKKIWALLDEPNKTFVSLSTPDFMSLGEGFDIPDEGKSIHEVATAAPDGAFDPRDLEKISPEKLGYKAQWWSSATSTTTWTGTSRV